MGNQKLTRCLNPKKTPPCLSECDKGILPALACTMGKGPQAAPLSRDAFLLMLSTKRRLLPNLCCLQHGDSPGSHQATAEKMLWISTQPSAFCHGNPSQNELWLTGPAPADSVTESDDDNSFWNRKLRGKVSYSSKSSALPWKCMNDAHHQFWGGRSHIPPVFTLSRCAWAAMSPERTWELNLHPTHTHFLGGIYLRI